MVSISYVFRYTQPLIQWSDATNDSLNNDWHIVSGSVSVSVTVRSEAHTECSFFTTLDGASLVTCRLNTSKEIMGALVREPSIT